MVGGGRYLADAETGECWMNVWGLLFKSEGGHGLRRRTRTLALSWPFFLEYLHARRVTYRPWKGSPALDERLGLRIESKRGEWVETVGTHLGPLVALFFTCSCVCWVAGCFFGAFQRPSDDAKTWGGDTSDGWTGRAVNQMIMAGEGDRYRVPDNTPPWAFFSCLGSAVR
jgi:hypothetical protein